MRELLNVLYVQTQGAVLHVEHDTVRVEVDGETKLRTPLLRLGGLVVFGQVTLTPFLIQRCAEDGRNLVWLDRNGRFKARAEGATRGNVLLRRAQHLALSSPEQTFRIARQIAAGKIRNCRHLLLRAAREESTDIGRAALAATAEKLGDIVKRLPDCSDLNTVRGAEGEAARAYFHVFSLMLRSDNMQFAMDGRSRRPPRDRMNSLLSFLYALVRNECASAAEGVGLDPQVGYLHALRPGRPALALDLMEEFRPILADRLALTLVNRRQLAARDFDDLPDGSVRLTDDGRKSVLVAYQKRKEEEIHHPALKERIPIGLVPHIQARLLARHLRGELAEYPPFIAR